MGLSSKQVSNREAEWNQTLLEAQNLEVQPHNSMRKQQHQNQQPELLKCPRCDSTNTKFCYYNNYNKSQPRHFCRACKRYWTKGGTLRNVPVGGGGKNKRVKIKATTPASNTTTTSITTTSVPSLEVNHDHKRIPSFLHQSLICPQPSLKNLMSSTRDSEDEDFGIGNRIFLSSTVPHTQNQSMIFPFTTSSSSLDPNPCYVSTSLPSSNNVYHYGEEFNKMEESTINSMMPIASGTNTQQSEIPATSIGMGMSNYWSWEDIDSLVSTDLNVHWDDSDEKKI